MKNAIKEYLELTNEEKKELLNTATIIFDTNVLLNLYRHSKETREELLDVMWKYRGRLWMPYQVAKEFMKNRINVIEETIKMYDTQKEAGKKYVDDCINKLNLYKNDRDCENLRKYIDKWINKKRNTNLIVTSPNEDVILEAVFKLYDSLVGAPYSEEQIRKLEKQGQERFDKKIPPGYMDAGKSNGKNVNNAYGDFIVWQQILDYAKENHRDIVYITNDQKEDWWNKIGGKTIGPRVELRKEFCDFTGQKFHMYQMNQFIDVVKQERKISKRVVDEINTFANRERLAEIGLMGMGYKPGIISELEHELCLLEIEAEKQERHIDEYYEIMKEENRSNKFDSEFSKMIKEYGEITREIDNLEREIGRLTIIGLGQL